MNKREQQEKQLKHLYDTLDAIEECINEGRIDENNDLVIPDYHATRIKVLLEDV